MDSKLEKKVVIGEYQHGDEQNYEKRIKVEGEIPNKEQRKERRGGKKAKGNG